MSGAKNNAGVAYSDLTGEESATDDDEVGLVLKDEDNSSPRSKKYVVSDRKNSSKFLPSWCQPSRMTRNERICVLVGCVALIAIVVVFIAIGVLASRSKGSASEAGGSNGTDHSGNGTTDHGNRTGAEVPWANIRLQSSIVPESYDINLTLDMNRFLVSGSISIMCTVADTVNFVALHVKGMNVSGHALRSIEGRRVEHNAVLYPENDFFVFNLSAPFQPGQIVVAMQFNYTLRDDLFGFYKSSYMDSAGTQHYLATTQFEPTDARTAFPCFDEPALKANFSMHITHHSRYRAWFNMPVVSRSEPDSNGMVSTSFQTSVRMSTYLVAFIVSEFQCINDTIMSISGEDIMIGVCSNPEVVENTRYALEAAMDIIMFYEEQFGVAYPLPKQDLFAIPDFAVGAMENWGLITYRETALLYNEATNPATSRQRVAVVIAHELAHQWFGDLVTMAWWDGLWLNEGFASFMEYIGTDHFEPSFNMKQQFLGEDLVTALDLDGLNDSHPIIHEVQDPDEINSLFDAISYSKGASIIRMVEGYIGEEAFRDGITSYLEQHRYGNAETPALWEALQSQVTDLDSGATVTEIMDTWTKQMGYPVLTVNQSTNTLTQTRFFYFKPDQDTIAPSPYQYIWKAPFNFIHHAASGAASGDHTVTQLSLVTSQTTPVQWPSGGWIKANINQTAFYRVNYEVENWLEIGKYLKTADLEASVLSPLDRAGLLDDAFALSYAGQLDTMVALNFSIYLVYERNYIPWEVAISWFYRFDGLLSLTPYYGNYRNFVHQLLRSVVTTLPMAGTNLTHMDIYLRSLMLQAAVHFGNTEIAGNATEMFYQWRHNDVSVDPDMKSLVYGVGVAEGGEDDWEFVWQRYLQSNDAYEKRLYLKALGQTKEPWLLNRYLNYSISKVRSQDTVSVIIYVSRNIHGRYLAWNFVQSNWPYLRKTFGIGSFFERFIRYITADFSTEFELEQMKEFFAKNPDAGTATRGFRQAIEVIKGNIAWLNIYRSGLFSDPI